MYVRCVIHHKRRVLGVKFLCAFEAYWTFSSCSLSIHRIATAACAGFGFYICRLSSISGPYLHKEDNSTKATSYQVSFRSFLPPRWHQPPATNHQQLLWILSLPLSPIASSRAKGGSRVRSRMNKGRDRDDSEDWLVTSVQWGFRGEASPFYRKEGSFNLALNLFPKIL